MVTPVRFVETVTLKAGEVLAMFKIRTTSFTALALLLGGGLPLLTGAQQTLGPPQADERGWSPPGGSMQVQTYQGVRFASGGIGLSGREQIRALSSQFNLQLMFAMHGGNYLADAQVRILDSRGNVVLDAESQGPYFLAQLSPGSYTVEASARGQTQRQTARVGQGQSRLNFFWR